MESRQLAAQLVSLTAYLRPDYAKVIEVYARAIAETTSFSDASVRVQTAFKTKKQREGLQAVVELLTALSVIASSRDELSELARLLAAPPPHEQKRPTTPEPAAAQETAEQVAAELKDARVDRDRFSALHRQLVDAKKISTSTLHQIANIFLGTNQRFSGRKKALDAILRRHHDELRIADQNRMLDRLE